MTERTKNFLFKVNQKRLKDGTVPADRTINVAMTQEQFESHQEKRDLVHQGIRAIGLDPRETVWFESPHVDKTTEHAFKELIGADSNAHLILYYPHSFHHRHYKEAVLNGVKYLYMGFQNGYLIKFAQSVCTHNMVQATA